MTLLALVAEIATGYAGAGIGDPIAAGRSLARYAGAEDILIFCFDSEVQTFLPAPPFAQTLPNASAWQRFIREVDEDGGSAVLPSPYRGSQGRPVQARRVDTQTVIALVGKESPLGSEGEEFWLAARLLGRIFSAARDVRIANARARLAAETARVNGEIAVSLLATRKKLEGSLAETRQERQKLRQSNDRLQLAQQIASMGLWEWNRRDKSFQMSPEMRRMCGLEGEPGGQALTRLLTSMDTDGRQGVLRAVRSALRTGEPAEVEVKLSCSDGSRRWIVSRIALGSDEAGSSRLVGVSLDMTRRHQSEEALRRAEALASAGRLAATIAHEINNPLESITNLLFIIGEDKSLSERTRECLGLADQEVTHLSEIARRTLTFYRETSAPVEIELTALLREVLDLYAPRLARSSVQIESHFGRDFRMVGFPGELKQLFSNLLVNAIDSMSGAKNGSGSRLILSTSYEGEMLRVSLEDTGTGIAPQHLKNLFQPFFTTKERGGTGLGLWVSQGVAKKHGGWIEVRSSVDPIHHGTIVTVYLTGAQPRDSE